MQVRVVGTSQIYNSDLMLCNMHFILYVSSNKDLIILDATKENKIGYQTIILTDQKCDGRDLVQRQENHRLVDRIMENNAIRFLPTRKLLIIDDFVVTYEKSHQV